MADWRDKNYKYSTRIVPAELERFMARVDKSGDCWIWTGYKNSKGYGKWNKWYAHRFSYVQLIGPISDGLQIDHLCLNTSCVNPAHLEAVTLMENVRRQMAQPGWHMPGNNGTKTQCINGHDFSGYDSRGKRYCQTCKNNWNKNKRHADPKKEQRVAHFDASISSLDNSLSSIT